MEMIRRHHALARLDALDDLWDDWERWFADLEETHTSQPSLVFFRSISHSRSWVTAAGVVLDTAALRASTLRLPANAQAQLCIRSGYLALRRIADYFGIPNDHDPRPDDPISIDRSEFEAVYDELASFGVPVRPNREACWQDYRGWRVNYDTVLLALAGLTIAPYSPWVSDRSLPYSRPPLTRRRTRRLSRHDDGRLLRDTFGDGLHDAVQPLALPQPRHPHRRAATRSRCRSRAARGRPAAVTCGSCTTGAR